MCGQGINEKSLYFPFNFAVNLKCSVIKNLLKTYNIYGKDRKMDAIKLYQS